MSSMPARCEAPAAAISLLFAVCLLCALCGCARRQSHSATAKDAEPLLRAVHEYRLENERLPSALDELIPKDENACLRCLGTALDGVGIEAEIQRNSPGTGTKDTEINR